MVPFPLCVLHVNEVMKASWDGKVIMSNPISCACSIVFRVTWLSCPSRTNKCQLIKDIPLGTNLFEKFKNSLNKKKIQALFWVTMLIPGLQNLM